MVSKSDTALYIPLSYQHLYITIPCLFSTTAGLKIRLLRDNADPSSAPPISPQF